MRSVGTKKTSAARTLQSRRFFESHRLRRLYVVDRACSAGATAHAKILQAHRHGEVTDCELRAPACTPRWALHCGPTDATAVLRCNMLYVLYTVVHCGPTDAGNLSDCCFVLSLRRLGCAYC